MFRASIAARSALLLNAARPVVRPSCLAIARQLSTKPVDPIANDLLDTLEAVATGTSRPSRDSNSQSNDADLNAIHQIVNSSIEAFSLRESAPSLPDAVEEVSEMMEAAVETPEPTVTAAMRTSMRDDPLLSQLVNSIMKDGKKARAQGYVARALLEVRARTHSDPYMLLANAIEQCSPILRLVSVRKGSKNVPVPFPLNERQRRRYAITWILKAAEKRNERRFPMRLASELVAVSQGQSTALDHRQRVHKEALAARANVQAGTQNRGRF